MNFDVLFNYVPELTVNQVNVAYGVGALYLSVGTALLALAFAALVVGCIPSWRARVSLAIPAVYLVILVVGFCIQAVLPKVLLPEKVVVQNTPAPVVLLSTFTGCWQWIQEGPALVCASGATTAKLDPAKVYAMEALSVTLKLRDCLAPLDLSLGLLCSADNPLVPITLVDVAKDVEGLPNCSSVNTGSWLGRVVRTQEMREFFNLELYSEASPIIFKSHQASTVTCEGKIYSMEDYRQMVLSALARKE